MLGNCIPERSDNCYTDCEVPTQLPLNAIATFPPNMEPNI